MKRLLATTAWCAILVLATGLGAERATADDSHLMGGDLKALPLFDAHIHYKQPAWDRYPVASIIELMDQNGVAMGLVSSTPDEGTIRLWKHAPNRIVPELRPYHGSAGSSNWTKMPGMDDYLEGRLEQYPHEGIGEFHIHRLDPDDEPLLRKVTQMAKSRGIPIHIHSGAAPVELLYRLEPSLTIIWAHAGMSEPPGVVEKMMEKYSTLYADTSFRELDILASDENLDPDWERVLKRFSMRFMVGTDTWVNSQWDRYGQLIDLNRRWLALLPRNVAERIAFRNAQTLFGREVSMQQIGTH